MKSEKIKVLLIEDNPGDARLLKEYLTEASAQGISKSTFEWATADRLANAKKLIESNRYDVVLLDLSLPDSHGLDTFERLQTIGPQLPIIVLSGLDDSSVAIEAVRKGAQDYLVKGEANASLLLRSIQYAIERKHLEESALQKNQQLDKLLANVRDNISKCMDESAGALSARQRELLTETLNLIAQIYAQMKTGGERSA